MQRPYIHLIARSKSSVADQNTYLIERIKELKTVSTPIAVMGQTYHDVVRFHTGRLKCYLKINIQEIYLDNFMSRKKKESRLINGNCKILSYYNNLQYSMTGVIHVLSVWV